MENNSKCQRAAKSRFPISVRLLLISPYPASLGSVVDTVGALPCPFTRRVATPTPLASFDVCRLLVVHSYPLPSRTVLTKNHPEVYGPPTHPRQGRARQWLS